MSMKKLAAAYKKELKEASKPFEMQFLDAVDEYLTKSRDDDEEERDSKSVIAFRPSSYYKCMRSLWYRAFKFPARGRTMPRLIRIREVGTALHEWVQRDVFMKMDKLPDSPIHLVPKSEILAWGAEGIEFFSEHHAPDMEIKFRDYRHTQKFPISAMVDGVLNFKGRDFILEFKTIKPEDYKLLIEPSKGYIMQGAIYALSLGIKSVMFVYLCKGTQEWRAFLVEYTPEQLEWVRSRLSKMEGYLLDQTLPIKEESEDCRWCRYKHLCEKEISTMP